MTPRQRLLLALSTVALMPAVAVPAAGRDLSPRQSVRVDQIAIDVAGQAALDAFLVRPAGDRTRHDHAGVVYLHWFEPGHASADASEFLPKAIALAESGVVSVLPQQRFPWEGDPMGDERDLAAVTRAVTAAGRESRRARWG
jgi:hypothetical protein